MKQQLVKIGERVFDPDTLKKFLIHRIIPWIILIGLALINDTSYIKWFIICSGMVVIVRLMDGYD